MLFILLLCLFTLSRSDCPADGVWKATPSGEVCVVPCQGDTVGMMTRRCRCVSHTSEEWDQPDLQFCLSKSPPKGKAYIDFIISIPYSKTTVISNKPYGIIEAYNYLYSLNGDAVSVYRIAREHSHYTSVQIRLSVPHSSSYGLYRHLYTQNATKELADFLVSNNDKGLKLDYLTEEGVLKCNILYDYGPYINYYEENYSHLVIVAVASTVGVVALGFVGWYSCIQIKRYRQEKQRARLITPVPREVQELSYQAIVSV